MIGRRRPELHARPANTALIVQKSPVLSRRNRDTCKKEKEKNMDAGSPGGILRMYRKGWSKGDGVEGLRRATTACASSCTDTSTASQRPGRRGHR